MSCMCKRQAGNDIELSPTCIDSLWIFQQLSPEDIEILGRRALRRKMQKGQTLFLQGEPADEVFLIKGGRIKLTKVLDDGTELVLDIRGAGDFVGENIFFEEGRYPVSAICVEKTLACSFTRSRMVEFVLKLPTIGHRINRTLNDRIFWSINGSGGHANSDFEERLYRVLCNVAKAHGVQSAQGEVIQLPLRH